MNSSTEDSPTAEITAALRQEFIINGILSVFLLTYLTEKKRKKFATANEIGRDLQRKKQMGVDNIIFDL
jgi:hypothetical protein